MNTMVSLVLYLAGSHITSVLYTSGKFSIVKRIVHLTILCKVLPFIFAKIYIVKEVIAHHGGKE